MRAFGIFCATLVVAISPAFAGDHTWTDNTDWAEGQEENVNHTDVADQIQLSEQTQPQIETPFIWIANSGSNTVAKIDTRTGSQYPGSPYRVCSNPSRTAVDVFGNCWVGCRSDGRLMKLRMDDGATLVDVHPGSGNVVRAVAIDGEGFVWAGIYDSNQMVKVDPNTGAVIKTVNNVGCPYGAAAEKNGHIWVVSRCQNQVTLLDRNGSIVGRYGITSPYGIATDSDGHAWVARYSGNRVVQFSVNNGAVLRDVSISGAGRGVAVDANGFVWVAMSSNNRVAKVDPVAGRSLFDVNVGANPVGVAVDDQNKIWVVNQSSSSATKIDAGGGVVGTYGTGGSGPYTYSDMTGFQLQTFAVPAQGKWTARWNAACTAVWQSLSWNANVPAGTEVTARVRTAHEQPALAAAAWAGPYNSGAALGVPDNQWIEIELALRSNDAASVVPAVHDVTLRWGGKAEVCDAMDNDCDGDVDENLIQACSTACGVGTEVCINGQWVNCDAPPVLDEICDYLDNDCDGDIDEGTLNACGECGPVPEEICDNIDNDCNGLVDDADCECILGSTRECGTDVGECETGQQVCEDVGGGNTRWGLDCFGSKPPTEEICDYLDNDCDGEVDEGWLCCAGETLPCGADVGACRPGLLLCDESGQYGTECLGSLGPSDEVCDCFDNDCDGEVDEGDLCGGGSSCVRCECALPCSFGECPKGQSCIEGFCVPRDCTGVTCGAGEVCEWGECVPTCQGIDCPAGLRCEAGECVFDDCRTDGCPAGQKCANAQCEIDPCYGLGCTEDQYCRAGECVDSCGRMSCPDGQLCVDGACVVDPCAAVNCDPGTFCLDGFCVDEGIECGEGEIVMPDGTCADDPCGLVECPAGEICDRGQCMPGDSDGDGEPDNTDPDIDGDGIANEDDFGPNGEDFRWDHDDDFVDDADDPDDDNDGIPDTQDVGPDGDDRSRDHDNDGEDDAADTDDDNDGIEDAADEDEWGNDQSYDFDNDGTADAVDLDDDNDGIYDDEDLCGDPPADCSHDHNNNGTDDPADLDDDNDGIPDAQDVGPDGEDWSRDHNNDGIHDGEDPDDDSDGVFDDDDVCRDGSDCHWDHDNDGLHDGADPDDDEDGVADDRDTCDDGSDCSHDTDNDGEDNAVDDDDDGDGVIDGDDAFPLDPSRWDPEGEASPPETCGCGATGAGGMLGILALLGLALRRRT